MGAVGRRDGLQRSGRAGAREPGRATIAKIFLGQITNWNDPAIGALNKGANLPNLKITPVFRSDGSGTSYAFTDYLVGVSAELKTKIGVSTQPAFPAGQGAKGSSGVAGLISRTAGAIGYADVAYAIDEPHQVRGGEERRREVPLPEPPPHPGRGARVPEVPANNELHIVNPPKSAPLAYPISTYTYVIVHKTTPHAAELRKMIFWALTTGPDCAVRGQAHLREAVDRPKVLLVAAEKTLKTIHT